jgi:hypothetical protein
MPRSVNAELSRPGASPGSGIETSLGLQEAVKSRESAATASRESRSDASRCVRDRRCLLTTAPLRRPRMCATCRGLLAIRPFYSPQRLSASLSAPSGWFQCLPASRLKDTTAVPFVRRRQNTPRLIPSAHQSTSVHLQKLPALMRGNRTKMKTLDSLKRNAPEATFGYQSPIRCAALDISILQVNEIRFLGFGYFVFVLIIHALHI